MFNKLLLLSIFTSISFAKGDFSEHKNAKRLYGIERQLKKNKLNRNFLLYTSKQLKKSKVFNYYKPSIDSLINIKDRLRKNKPFECNKHFSKSKNSNHRKFVKLAKKYCYHAFIYLLKEKNSKFLTSDRLKSPISFYVKNNNKNFLKRLDRLDKDKDLYQTIQSLITTTLLDNEIAPSNDIYPHISFSKKITNIIQNNVNYKRRNKLIFTREFLSLYADFEKIRKSTKDIEHMSKLSEHLLSFHQGNKNYIFRKTAWKRLSLIGRYLLRNGAFAQSEKVIDYIIALSYNDESYNESIFMKLWHSIHQNNTKKTLIDIDKLDLISNFPKLHSKNKFWIAYSLFQEGDLSIANHLFKLLIKQSPLSYYSIISQSYVPTLTEKEVKSKYLNNGEKYKGLLETKDLKKAVLKNINEMFIWKDLNFVGKSDAFLYDFIRVPSKDLISNSEILQDYDDQELSLIKFNYFMNLFKINQDYLSSFKFISRAIDKGLVSNEMINLNNLFPTLHISTIKKHTNGVDPFLILSIIRQESAFNSKAKSSVGAMGLMQLMPYTAKSIQRNIASKKLLTPQKNIELGVKYFRKLLKRFDGSLIYSLAAYNAGPHKVKRWIKTIFSKEDPIKLIEEIPYKETRLYVKLIYRNIFFYNLMNNNYILNKSLDKTFKVSSNTTKR